MEDRHDTPEIENTAAPQGENEAPLHEEYNASFEPDPMPGEGMSEDELQDSILADSNMTGFQRFVAKLDDKTFILYQRILGAVLGVASGVALFWKVDNASNQGAFSWGLIIAIVLAMLVPNIIERRAMRKIPQARIALVIGLSVSIVAFFAYTGITKGF